MISLSNLYSLDRIANFFGGKYQKGDVVITMGAGDFSKSEKNCLKNKNSDIIDDYE